MHILLLLTISESESGASEKVHSSHEYSEDEAGDQMNESES